jgi:hypothetical protein
MLSCRSTTPNAYSVTASQRATSAAVDLAGVYIQNSSYNVINHLRIGGDGKNGVLIANSPSNTIYNN